MRLEYKIIDLNPENSYTVRRETHPCLEEVWHYHKEYELIYFACGNGVRYVGNTVERFDEGEIYLIGSNLPHLFKNEYDVLQVASVDIIIIQFTEEFLGNGFLNLPESRNLKSLLQMSSSGLKFSKTTSSLLHAYFIGIVYVKGLAGLVDLLKILNVLSISGDCETICSQAFVEVFRNNEKERIAKIRNFLIENYHRKIELQEVATLANMTTNAFCRFFKRSTRKSFSEYLNEIRVGNACKLLIEGKKQISEISCSTGFYSLSNFNRRFKSVMGVTPSEYLSKYYEKPVIV